MSFTLPFDHAGKTYQAEATYVAERGDFDLVLRLEGADVDRGTWNPDAYAALGFEDAERAGVANAMLCDSYGEKWTLTLPVLEAGKGGVKSSDVDRIGGGPIGVDVAAWPRLEHLDEPMQHVITLSGAHFANGVLPSKAAAVALFVWNPEDNEAFEPDTECTRVLFLSAEDLARGETDERPEGYDESRDIEAVPVVVKDVSGTFDEVAGDHIGRPLDWCQSPEGDDIGEFLFQFGESLLDINLGDYGTLYVFSKAAWWQCH